MKNKRISIVGPLVALFLAVLAMSYLALLTVILKPTMWEIEIDESVRD